MWAGRAPVHAVLTSTINNRRARGAPIRSPRTYMYKCHSLENLIMRALHTRAYARARGSVVVMINCNVFITTYKLNYVYNCNVMTLYNVMYSTILSIHVHVHVRRTGAHATPGRGLYYRARPGCPLHAGAPVVPWGSNNNECKLKCRLHVMSIIFF